MPKTGNTQIKHITPLLPPNHFIDCYPAPDHAIETVLQHWAIIQNILTQKDQRLLVIAGPCSIHDPNAALEYAKKLNTLRQKYHGTLCIMMRVYFEKPRTTTGWKGLINDPNLDGSFDIHLGLRTARKLLIDINNMGLAAGTEFLDTIIPQYTSDQIAWAAIGARTTESQTHREMSSGLSMPIGFKNGTRGSIDIAADAICSARNPHHFLGISNEGQSSIVHTLGNPSCHIILRGASDHVNYTPEHIDKTKQILAARELPQRIMVDCSHGNSGKNYARQKNVIHSICQQKEAGDNAIFGVMLESNLVEGSQPLSQQPLRYGQSITDSCIGWEETETLLATLDATVRQTKKVSWILKSCANQLTR